MNRIRTLVLVCMLSAWSVSAQNVVIVVIDGLRYSESFGSSDTHIPNIWNSLRVQGLLWTHFRNEGVTSTNPGHASIETGTWQTIPNDGTQRPSFPTIFEYFRKETGSSEQSCAVIVGKSKLDILTHSTHPEYGPAYAAMLRIATDDAAVIDSLKAVLTAHRPRLILINLPDVDVAGHAGIFANYLTAISRADSLTAEIWNVIQSDPFYIGTTTMFITNDHGRHDDAHGGFQGHGDSCEGCRHIMLLALGRSIPSDRVTAEARSQIDIAPTVAALVGFSAPFSQGTNLLADTVTAVSRHPENSALPAFGLSQNYPNPFNPSTRIPFAVPEAGRVRVCVYDLLGRALRVLMDGVAPAGGSTLTFDATGFASGTYIVRLSHGSRVSQLLVHYLR
jgi:hypothetical protein